MKKKLKYIKTIIVNFFKLYYKKKSIQKLSPILKNGQWLIYSRHAYAVSSECVEILNFAFKFLTKHKANLFFFPNKTKFYNKKNEGNINGDVVLITRDKNIKIFDCTNNYVYTKTSVERYNTICLIRNEALFSYFNTPEINLINIGEDYFLKETFFREGPISNYDDETILKCYKEFANTYRMYIEGTGVHINPIEIIHSIEEIIYECFDYTDNNFIGKMLDDIKCYLQRSCWVAAHLDINIGNIIYLKDTNRILLIDYEDYGLKLPALYDFINFSYNEYLYRGNMEYILLLLDDTKHHIYMDIFKSSIIDFKTDDICIALITHCFMRELITVRSKLGVSKTPQKKIVDFINKITRYHL